MSAAPARKPRTGAGPDAAHGRPATAGATTRPELRVVAAPRFSAPRGPFVLAVGAVLTLGLLGVLGINTMVAQDAFALSDLRTRSDALADQEQTLTQQVAREESPAQLEERARELGMVPSVNPVFLRLSDGAVLGEVEVPKAVKTKAAAATDQAATDQDATDQSTAEAQ